MVNQLQVVEVVKLSVLGAILPWHGAHIDSCECLLFSFARVQHSVELSEIMTFSSHQVELCLVAEKREQKFQMVAYPLNLLWRVWVWLCGTLASGLVKLGLGLLG